MLSSYGGIHMTAELALRFAILAISRASHLVYVGDTEEALSFLSEADRFFRHAASPDRLVTLSAELAVLSGFPLIDSSLGPAVFRDGESAGIPDEGAVFIPRMSVIGAVMELGVDPGLRGSVVIRLSPWADGGDTAGDVAGRGPCSRILCRVTRGARLCEIVAE